MPPHELEVEVDGEEFAAFNGRYHLGKYWRYGAPEWDTQEGPWRSIIYREEQGGWILLIHTDFGLDMDYTMVSSRCSGSTLPQDVEGWFDFRTDKPVTIRISVPEQAARAGVAALAAPRDEAAQLTAQLAEAKADAAKAKANAERLREAARGADELRRQVAELKGLLAVLSEDLTKAEAAAAPPRGAVARYYNRYADSIEARTPTQVSAFLWNLLLLCAEIPGAGPESEFVAMHQRLIRDVDKRVEEDVAKGVHYGRPEAEVRVALIWSTGSHGCATYYGEPLEFSAWINLILVYRDSDRPLKLALPFVRTLNRFCVTAPRAGHADAAPGERWPGKEMDAIWVKIGRNDWNVYRGSGMSVEHKGWFIPGLVFRQPRYLATSLKLDQAEHFARERTMDGRIPVVWVVQIDKRRKCCHVNNLGSRYSMFREEAELLFPPCSVFTVRAVDWAAPGSGRTSRITIEAAPDNKDHPLDLPEAPWS